MYKTNCLAANEKQNKFKNYSLSLKKTRHFMFLRNV